MSQLAQRSIHISVAFALTVMLIVVGTQNAFGAMSPLTYPCSSHCYGVNTWSSSTQYFGAYTDISLVQLGCDPQCASDGFIDEEMWLVDTNSCVHQFDGLCWVEIGYIDYQAQHNWQAYFWGDERPGQPFMFDLFNNVQNTDFGNTNHFVIIKDTRTTPIGFQVLIYNDSSHTFLQGISNDNAITANEIMIGQEIVGTDGASAPRAIFTQNKFATQALSSDNQFVYTAQTTEGTVISNNPPAGQWATDPASSGNAFDGGQFSTSCC